jgi:hypothetical protein
MLIACQKLHSSAGKAINKRFTKQLKKMQYRFFFFALITTVLLSSCEGMFDNLEEYSGEIIYPGRYDTIVGHVGYERVEIDLMNAGRIPSSQVKLGKARKTVVEYDDKIITIDSLVSWVNITGLTQPKLYRFNIYTIDEHNNKSVPQEIALIPFTEVDLNALAINSPRTLLSPTAAVVDWPNGLSSVLLDYYGLSFKYTDKDGTVREGERAGDPRFFVSNLSPGEAATIEVAYKVVPKVNNVRIVDTVTVVKSLRIEMPTGSTTFAPTERDVLTANGVTVFTADGVSEIDKLVYPVHANSLQDIFYFPKLQELDLTGGALFPMTTLHYDHNNVQATVGGGDLVPFARKVSDVTAANVQTLKDLLESGLLTKVRYIPHSMGLDDLLAPYVVTGVVELVDRPDEALIPMRFLVDGVVQDNAWQMDIVNPAIDAPAGSGLENVLKTTLRARSASFVFILPTEYRFNIQEYRYLKFKVYAPDKSVFAGIYAPYQRIWPRVMNYLWSFASESSFGQEYWAHNPDDFKIADADLQQWIDVTVDMSQAASLHNRVVVINVGGEPSLTFAPPADIVYYFANFRFAKE